MAAADSDLALQALDLEALDPEAMARARRLLAPVEPRERLWPPLAAAFCFAVAALSFAVAMIVAPPLVTAHVVG